MSKKTKSIADNKIIDLTLSDEHKSKLISPNQYMDMFDKFDTGKNGRIKQARAFWIRTYQTKDSIDLFLSNNSKRIRSFAYILHDKDVDKNGELVTPHFHLVIRMYSQWSRKRLYKLLIPYLWIFSEDTKEWSKIANIDLEISSDYKANYLYLTHTYEPEKYQYDASNIVTNDADDFGKNDDKCTDGSFEIVNDLIDGKSQLYMLKKYGREYVINKQKYELMAQCIIYENNCFMEECDARSAAYLRSKPCVQYDNGSAIDVLNEMRRILGVKEYR